MATIFPPSQEKKGLCHCKVTLETHLNQSDIQRTDRAASSYILIMKTNEMHCFSDLFDKVLYMFRTVPLSIIRSI